MMFNNVGRPLPRLLWSDAASNFTPIAKLENEKSPDIVNEMRKIFHSNGITFHIGTPASSHRQGLSESVVKLFKKALKRSNILNKTFTQNQWLYLVSKITKIINERPLSVEFLHENFHFLTPSLLLFGSQSRTFPADLTENISTAKLFEKLSALDKELDLFLRMWEEEYFLTMRRWQKWKHANQLLGVDDIVMIADKINSETLLPTLGRVKEIISPRTFRLQYVKSSATLDKNTFEIKKNATLSTIERPAQQIILLVKADSQDKNISLEEDFSSNNNNDDPDDLNYENDVFKDNLAADDDKRLKVTFQDDNIDNIQDVVDLKQRRSKKTK